MKIKHISFVLILFVNALVAQENFFEGTIAYALTFHDKTGEMSDAEAKQFMGSEQIYYMKGNKYKTVMNGMLRMQQYYTGNDSIYTQMAGSKILMYVKADELKEKIIGSKETKSALQIMGKDCNLLEIETNEGSLLYYYNSEYKVKPEDYKNHKYSLWYYCLQKSGGALPLKLIIDTKEIKSVIEAQKIERKVLDSGIFELPKGMQLVKMPE